MTREYDEIQRRLAQGWNTWNTRSVLSHVLLPEAFALNLGIKDFGSRGYLKEALIGRKEQHEEHIHPGPRTYDGRYTELRLAWRGVELTVQSATVGEDLLLLVTPHTHHRRAPLLTVESGILWNRAGYVCAEGEALVGHLPTRTVRAWGTGESVYDPHVAAQTAYLSFPLEGPVGVHTGTRRSLGEIESIISRERAAHRERSERFGALAEIYEIVQTVMAWDTIYEPEQARVVSPVSRIWNIIWGGFGLFEWDNYFAAYLASLESREIAYVNAVEMTRCRTETGLVPNLAIVYDIKSRDRSEPPVGAFVVRELYRRYRDRWLLEMLYDDLLEWNRWWSEHRDWDGLLCWGSDPYEPVVGSDIELRCVHDREGSALESGLDNSPMFDDVPFDEQRNLMAQADVGLMGMYILDCEALADIARVLGKQDDVAALTARADRYRRALAGLWDEEHGVYWNRRMDSRQPNPRFGATCFYPLLGRVPTQAQAERLVREHFYNPGEFWGEWILPSISRNDAAYQDQNYWRGRIWPPMNFLVYLGLRNYALPEARADLVERSLALLLKEWRDRGHVHENYNANTGEGCDHHNSDAFYHWGALLGLMQLVEEGHVPAPEVPLS